MEFEGRLILELPEQSGTSAAGREWRKKEWVLETLDARYPHKVCVQAFGEDRIANLHFEIGKCYAVGIDIESREWQGKWFTNVTALSCREIEAPGMSAPTQSAQTFAPQPQFGQPAAPSMTSPASDETDDLPF